MNRPRILDLFCGAGGAGMGYIRAGFDVVGIDIAPQPDYPGTYIPCDALAYAEKWGRDYDAIHASPPCPRLAGILETGEILAVPQRVDGDPGPGRGGFGDAGRAGGRAGSGKVAK